MYISSAVATWLPEAFKLASLMALVYSAVYDWKYRILPDFISLPIILIGLVVALTQDNYVTYIIGSAVGFGIVLLVALIGNTGGGDIKLCGALGVVFGYPSILGVMLIGAVLGAIYGIIKIVWNGVRHKDLKGRAINELAVGGNNGDGLQKEQLPLGTFLIIGAWITYLL